MAGLGNTMDSNEKNLDSSLDSAMNMTQEEIERFLAQQESQSNDEQFGFDDADLESLLSELGEEEDADIQEISNLLNKADNNEAVAEDVVALMNRQDTEGENAYEAMDLFSGEQSEKKEGFFKRFISNLKIKRKETQEKKQQKQQEKELKKEQKKRNKQQNKQEQQQNVEPDNHNENAGVEDSMAEALSLLNAKETVSSKDAVSDTAKEDTTDKKKKEKKSKKNKKEKKASNVPTETDDEEQISDKPSKKKKEKKVKEKKTKEKKGKENKNQDDEPIREKKAVEVNTEVFEEEETEAPNKKKIIMVFVAAIMIMLGFLVVNYYFTGHTNKKLAEEAYEEENYLECYQLMYGQRLNDSQNSMFHRSELILKMDIFWNHYEEFVANNQLLEGVDRLVQFVEEYSELSSYAAEWNCLDIVEGTYNKVIMLLKEDYKVDEQTIFEIATIEDDIEYTRALVELVNVKIENDAINQAYPDILPPEHDRITQN